MYLACFFKPTHVLHLLHKLFKQTFIYGLATVLPRVLSFFLLPLYTLVFKDAAGYGQYTNIYAWIAIFNVFLAYGMETAFFRFYHKSEDKEKVVSTALLSLLVSSLLFLGVALWLQHPLSQLTSIPAHYIQFTSCILVLDALASIPFVLLRAQENPVRYAVIKILNVAVNLGFSIFFLLLLPQVVEQNPNSFFSALYKPRWEIPYIFIANVIASGSTLLLVLPTYFKIAYRFDVALWKQMLRYAAPVMVAGIAFAVNEVLDKILLMELLPKTVAATEVGKYGACYKLALFMTLFGTAFRMGVEPFFFSQANAKNPRKVYAQITYYFVLLGSAMLLGVVVFIEVLGQLFIRNSIYREALPVVPILLLGSFCLGMYYNLSVWYKVTDRTQYGAYISCVGAAITLTINLLFIPQFGYWASAWATLAAYGSMLLLSYALGRKYYPVPYKLRRMGGYVLLSLVFAALSFYVFHSNVLVGSLFLFVFLALVYVQEGSQLKKLLVYHED